VKEKEKEKNVPVSGNSDRRRLLLLPFGSLNGPGEAFGLGPATQSKAAAVKRGESTSREEKGTKRQRNRSSARSSTAR
jgi:hypothetical protein